MSVEDAVCARAGAAGQRHEQDACDKVEWSNPQSVQAAHAKPLNHRQSANCSTPIGAKNPPCWPSSRLESPVYAVGATLAVIVGFLLSGLAQGLDHWSTDLQIATLSPRRPAQYPRIALIVITDRTLQDRPYTSPIDRQLIADLVERLDAAGAKVIGLDIVFDRPTEPSKDGKLIAVDPKGHGKGRAGRA